MATIRRNPRRDRQRNRLRDARQGDEYRAGRTPLAGPQHLEATQDMPLLTRAVKSGWNVPSSLKARVLETAEAALDHEDRSVRLAAGRLIVAADLVDAKREATAAADQRTESTLAVQILRSALADPASAAALEALTATLPVKPDQNITSQSTPSDS